MLYNQFTLSQDTPTIYGSNRSHKSFTQLSSVHRVTINQEFDDLSKKCDNYYLECDNLCEESDDHLSHNVRIRIRTLKKQVVIVVESRDKVVQQWPLV